MNETLLIVTTDKRAYEKWVRDWGSRASNIQYVFASNKEDVEGWDRKSTFYMILNNKKRSLTLTYAKALGYREVGKKNIEAHLKKLKPTSITPT